MKPKYILFFIIFFILVFSTFCQESVEPLNRILKDGKWGYINSTGEVIVQPEFDHAYPFRNGFTVVLKEIDGQMKRAYLNNKGELITDYQFDRAYHFFGELARVKIGNLWGYINKNGVLVTDCIYSWVSDFDYGVGIVKKDGIFGMVKPDGSFIGFPDFTSIRFYNEFGSYREEKKYGLLGIDGTIITNPIYDSINIVGKDTIIIKYNSKYRPHKLT